MTIPNGGSLKTLGQALAFLVSPWLDTRALRKEVCAMKDENRLAHQEEMSTRLRTEERIVRSEITIGDLRGEIGQLQGKVDTILKFVTPQENP